MSDERIRRSPISATRSGSCLARWAELPDEERARRRAAFAEAQRRRWAAMSPKERARHVELAAEGRRRSVIRPDAIARGRYRSNGLSDEEIDYLLTLPQNERKVARLRHRDYGISPLTYRDLMAAQKGRCALCRVEVSGRNAHLDHDHAGGGYRGILCARCNLALGHMEERGEQWISDAFAYIATKRGPEGV